MVSYWLHIDRYGIIDLLAEIPGIGFLIENAARPATYYTVDSLEHYQREVHEAILHVVDELADTGGGAALLPEERQPIWERIW